MSEFEIISFRYGEKQARKALSNRRMEKKIEGNNRQKNQKYNEKNREKRAAAAREKGQHKKAHVHQIRQHTMRTVPKVDLNEEILASM